MDITDISKELKDIDQGNLEDDHIILGKEKIGLSASNYKELQGSENNMKCCFIDGGNIEIIKANNLSLQLVRIAGVVFEGNKRVGMEKEEFFVLVKTVVRDRVYYNATCFGKNEEFVFDAYEKSLSRGGHRADISMIADTIRRYHEIRFVKQMISKGIDIIVRDGTLTGEVINEDKYFEDVLLLAKQEGVGVIGIAKTNSMITQKGRNASGVIMNNSPYQIWRYKIKEDRYFAKLHPKSKHAFKIETANCDESMWSYLVQGSKDGVFPGYPYGLVMADRMARVSFDEKSYYLTKLKVELGKEWEKIQNMMSTQDAHEILDTIG